MMMILSFRIEVTIISKTNNYKVKRR